MPQRRKPSDMRLMSVEQQLEVQQRLTNRREATEAMKRLNDALIELLDGDKARFKAIIGALNTRGHKAQYHETPSETARRRQLAAQVKQLLRETPLNWMGAVELSYNVKRIDLMTEALRTLLDHDSTVKEILDTYEDIGNRIRQRVQAETGHVPEEFPAPRDRMTGNESDDLFKLADHQPKLFD